MLMYMGRFHVVGMYVQAHVCGMCVFPRKLRISFLPADDDLKGVS